MLLNFDQICNWEGRYLPHIKRTLLIGLDSSDSSMDEEVAQTNPKKRKKTTEKSPKKETKKRKTTNEVQSRKIESFFAREDKLPLWGQVVLNLISRAVILWSDQRQRCFLKYHHRNRSVSWERAQIQPKSPYRVTTTCTLSFESTRFLIAHSKAGQQHLTEPFWGNSNIQNWRIIMPSEWVHWLCLELEFHQDDISPSRYRYRLDSGR